jgi:hypothetical protein
MNDKIHKLVTDYRSAPVSSKSTEEEAKSGKHRKRLVIDGGFLLGPISWEWLTRAAKLGRGALEAALVIHFENGFRQQEIINLRPSTLRKFGVSRHTTYRALQALEEADLIAVDRHRGRAPTVTILHQDGRFD